MPELPEVETLRRSLLTRLVGRRIEEVEVRERRLRYRVDVRRLRRDVRGRRVEDVRRRAKYLLIHLEGDRRLVIHLGMSGRLLVEPAGDALADHVHVVFLLDDGMELRFRDHRRFGLVDSLKGCEVSRDRRFARLGPEPLSDDCDGAYFHERSRGSRKPVKNFLMDSHQVVGVGNIYASEALFLAAVNPRRAAGRVGRATWDRVAGAVKEVLRAAIRQGGTTLNDFQNAAGEEGTFQVSLRVYGREGEPCSRCGRPIRRTVLAGRSTFHCTRCQR
ncbi:MAG: bifunctional DNA-formamidopyrimidine glycosylase/DNA-(apurinic or apyrimidinic site) lyase [Planctomycetota bacterium]|nr:bifunctional DNA-formamidopyrimidine glycosylase/DNA-(apurinic or apyrimidinic site) lyase [Planctomycetota bacterium]